MRFFGIQKTTLVDYPGKVAATLFTHGCNFRCPFCHNPELVTELFSHDAGISIDDVLAFLEKRRGKLDGIVVTGGEPLMHRELIKFLPRIKDLGFAIKIDTNGTFPGRIKKLEEMELVDYWAMDIKNSADRYTQTCGANCNIDLIKKSISFIMESGSKYEFRTTFVPVLHDISSARGIGELVKGAKRFAIQNFHSGKTIDPEFSYHRSYNKSELNKFKLILEEFVDVVIVRE